MVEVRPFTALQEAIHADPEYAWGWHCNLAMPILDAIGVSHERANLAAAHLMSFLFNYDITTHPHFVGIKSEAQKSHEFRLQMERDEDAMLAERSK